MKMGLSNKFGWGARSVRTCKEKGCDNQFEVRDNYNRNQKFCPHHSRTASKSFGFLRQLTREQKLAREHIKRYVGGLVMISPGADRNVGRRAQRDPLDWGELYAGNECEHGTAPGDERRQMPSCLCHPHLKDTVPVWATDAGFDGGKGRKMPFPVPGEKVRTKTKTAAVEESVAKTPSIR
jgi:hypothetical protein